MKANQDQKFVEHYENNLKACFWNAISNQSPVLKNPATRQRDVDGEELRVPEGRGEELTGVFQGSSPNLHCIAAYAAVDLKLWEKCLQNFSPQPNSSPPTTAGGNNGGGEETTLDLIPDMIWMLCGTTRCQSCRSSQCTDDNDRTGLDRDKDEGDLKRCPAGFAHKGFKRYPQWWPFADLYLRICTNV